MDKPWICTNCNVEYASDIQPAFWREWYDDPWATAPDAEEFVCYMCALVWWQEQKERHPNWVHYQEEPTDDDLHDLCHEWSDDSDFAPQYCEECEREVVQRCPRQGYRSYFMVHPDPDIDDLICVACYQRIMMEHGHWAEHFADGECCHADFYNYGELDAAGYVQEGGEYFIPSQFDTYRQHGRKLLADGKRVLTDLLRSGMGLEGYVQLWVAAERHVAPPVNPAAHYWPR